MPWVNQDMCAGCGICVDHCPTGAIQQENFGKAIIDDGKCIRCGKCHTACPKDAVRHDSEKIPEMVKQNVPRVKNKIYLSREQSLINVSLRSRRLLHVKGV